MTTHCLHFARKFLELSRIAPLILLALLTAPVSFGYSVLTHEAIVDSLWDASVKKMLLKRFPGSTPEDLEQAHAYVYGGCILQDMGYYPFSSRPFSDLTHYVRSGDFIVALIRESQDLNEYAFALGALAHYAADTSGHRIATNLAVPMLYPELHTKFGKEVTYWDAPVAHLRTEFGFDVLQVARGRYAPDSYRRFIGFQVSKPVLERAFLDTYGLELKDVFGNLSLALGSFRYSVGSIIPGITRVAWQLKRDEVTKEIPGITKKKFLFNLSRSSYEKEWGSEYRRPGVRSRMLAWVLRLVPKSGPFKSLAFRTPTPEIEKMFMASFNATVNRYKELLGQESSKALVLPNQNFDVGDVSRSGGYKGTDLTYAMLVDKLASRQFADVSPELRKDILAFYKDAKAPKPTRPEKANKKATAEWTRLGAQLSNLRSSKL